MSGGPPVNTYERLIVENYCIIASSAVLWFDFALTFTTEVRRIWHRKFTGATLVYLLMRYIAIIERVFFVLEVLLWKSTDEACAGIIHTDDILVFLNYLAFSAFTALRIYAVWDRDWKTLIIVVPLALVKPIIVIYEDTLYVAEQAGPPFGCVVNWVGNTNDQLANLSTMAKATTIACDAILIIFTWIKTFGIQRAATKCGARAPLATFLLRDGTTYSTYVAVAILLSIQIVTITTSYIGSTLTVWIVWPYFDQVLTVIFFSRFMLDLRGLYFADRPRDDCTGTLTGGGLSEIMSDIHFRVTSRMVGNLGATLATTPSYSSADRAASRSGDRDFAGVRPSAHPLAREQAARVRVVGHRAAREGIEEVERVHAGQYKYASEEEGRLEWYDDEKPTYTLHPFEAGMMSDVELAHPPGSGSSPVELESVTPVSPASPETLATHV